MSETQPKYSKFEQTVRNQQRILFGERYEGASLSTLDAPTWAQEIICGFIKNPKNFLVYCGNAGIGKTHFASSMIPIGLSEFNSFRYWKESDLLSRVRESIENYKSDYLTTLKHLLDDELIIIDDIGSNGLNDWRKEILFNAIDLRYCTMQPTIIISNFTKKDFQDLFHERFCSRIFAKENAIIEIHNGPDHRQMEVKSECISKEI